MAHNTLGLMKVVDNLPPEWHIPIYADGDEPDFLKEISAWLTEEHGVNVTDPIYVIYEHYTVMRATSGDREKIEAVCDSLAAKGAVLKKDCDGLRYMYFTNSEFGDLF